MSGVCEGSGCVYLMEFQVPRIRQPRHLALKMVDPLGNFSASGDSAPLRGGDAVIPVVTGGGGHPPERVSRYH